MKNGNQKQFFALNVSAVKTSYMTGILSDLVLASCEFRVQTNISQKLFYLDLCGMALDIR